ncbi:MAG: Rpn family recombination-promoting nuclease/putative transposase [Bacteroidales bacterium]|jgi:predicted transposase/invertase (TIGR01784 family)
MNQGFLRGGEPKDTKEFAIIDLSNDDAFVVRLTSDYAFKLVFGDERNKSILIDFLQRVLKCHIEDLSILQSETLRSSPSDKLGLMDLKARINDGSKVNVEIQLHWIHGYPERSLFYWSEMYSESFRRGMAYTEAKKCIAINIIDAGYTLNDRLHSIFKILECHEYRLLTDKLEMHFFNLEKLREGAHEEIDANLMKWLRFIQTSDPKERRSLSMEIPALEDANKVMESIYNDPQKRENYKARQKAERDYLALLREMELRKEEGIAAGREEGIAVGREEGLAVGREEGREQGVEQVVLAIQMKQCGESLEAIKKATGLKHDVLAKLGIS